MGELGAFLKIQRVGFRQARSRRSACTTTSSTSACSREAELRRQGARCMDCGIPFCHEGCPLGNLIPDWNDLVYRDKWREAIDQLHATNNFPEFTGRICPAPCESACVLAINDDPVTIEQIELAIAERAFDEGWVVPEPPARRSGKTRRGRRRRAGGAGGRRRAQPLRSQGDRVRARRGAGRADALRRARRQAREVGSSTGAWTILEPEGIEFVYGADVGRDVTAEELRDRHDALVVAIGSRVSAISTRRGASCAASTSRWTTCTSATAGWPQQEGRAFTGDPSPATEITAAGKRVIVVGGGDTGMDCISNSHREGARERRHARRLPGAQRRRGRPAASVAAAAEAHADDLRAGGGRQAALGHRGDRLRRPRRARHATSTRAR